MTPPLHHPTDHTAALLRYFAQFPAAEALSALFNAGTTSDLAYTDLQQHLLSNPAQLLPAIRHYIFASSADAFRETIARLDNHPLLLIDLGEITLSTDARNINRASQRIAITIAARSPLGDIIQRTITADDTLRLLTAILHHLRAQSRTIPTVESISTAITIYPLEPDDLALSGHTAYITLLLTDPFRLSVR